MGKSKVAKPIDVADLWTPAVKPFVSNVKPNRQEKVAGIVSERLFYGIKDECDFHPILEDCWESQVTGQEYDFILVETCLFTFLDDWRYALTPEVSENFIKFCMQIKALNIPLVLWFTLDVGYFELFSKSLSYFDEIFVADELLLERLKGDGALNVTYLPPAIQPRLFNPIRTLNLSKPDFSRILIEGGKSLENGSPLKDALIGEAKVDFTSFERSHTPPKDYFEKSHKAPNISFRGKVSHRLLPEILKNSRLIISSPQSRTTRMERRWRAIENAACMCPTVLFGEYESGLGENIVCLNDEVELTNYIGKLLDGSLENASENHKKWREAFLKNTFSDRLKKIREVLGRGSEESQVPLFSVITPTMRPERLALVLKNFERQKYTNKELVIVVNSSHDDYLKIKAEAQSEATIKVCYMPSDNYAASALNFATQFCHGEYVFRFDDDDYYGDAYLEDTALMMKSYSADVVGKFASFVKIDGKPDVYLRNATYLERNLRAYTSGEVSNKFGRISGATFGVRRKLLDAVPFPDLNLASADSAFLEKLRIEAPETSLLKTDCFNFTIGRKANSEGHTWNFDAEKLLKGKSKVPVRLLEVPR